MREKIVVNLKFYSGIDKELNLENYNHRDGITLEVKEGARLNSVLRDLGIRDAKNYLFFRDMERISGRTKLKNNDTVSCLRPSGGG